jgi:6-pyruvoyltetrahydropterin/6-carboxytetrahydropterin synthase
LHGHNWKIEVEVTATTLDEAGMGIDFKVIRSATRQVSELLDHRYLNEVEPFLDVSPTAENIAAFFYQRLGALLNNERVRISTITIWETERACVRYSET